MLTFVTFLLLCYSAVMCNSHGVFWTIVDKRVAIGHNLNLYCNESSLAAINCCPKDSTRRWFGGPNRELLYKNGVSSYPSKYTSRLEDGGFYLTIHNVEVKDLNVSYACSVAIYEYINILRPHYDIVLPETSMSTKLSVSTKLSMSTEPSISGNTTIGWGDSTIIFLTTFLVLFIVVYIVGSNKRVKKLLMGIFCSNNTSTTSENGKKNINMELETNHKVSHYCCGNGTNNRNVIVYEEYCSSCGNEFDNLTVKSDPLREHERYQDDCNRNLISLQKDIK